MDGNCIPSQGKFKAVPIWIRLCGLGLKFWGENCLPKLGSLFGKFMRVNCATLDKTRLGYARLMIEVHVGQDLPDKIYFKDEKGVEVSVLVEYEWRPDICNICKGIGHISGKCRKAGVSSAHGAAPAPVPVPVPARPVQVWRPVVRPRPVINQKGKAPMQATVANPVSPSLKFGVPTYHDSSVLVPVSPIIQVVRQEHNTPASTSKTYAECVSSGNGSPEKNGGTIVPIIMETKVKAQDFLLILNNLGQNWYGMNNNIHHNGGGVWLLWASQVFHVTHIACSAQQIIVEVTKLATRDVFWFTVVYGLNDEEDRRSLWTELQQIKDMTVVPWCIYGDFNVVLNFNERKGRSVL
ncbi:uncharacterized protein LOC141633001 [Silene latifolia]|uniref:uncharacterized protein LOC141633001 n=1 Tax=Silene latifolia TaxID=37657 RepID=UPI003D78A535